MVAKRLAALIGFAYGGEYDCSAHYPGKVYFVPSNTLIGLEHAVRMHPVDGNDGEMPSVTIFPRCANS